MITATNKKTKTLKMRVSQGAIAKDAIRDITRLYRKMGLAAAVADAKASTIADATTATTTTSASPTAKAAQGTTPKCATTVVVNTPGGGLAYSGGRGWTPLAERRPASGYFDSGNA